MKKAAVCCFLALTPHLLLAQIGYVVHNLVADSKSTATADNYDPRLINPWGNAVSAASPFWICDFGVSTLYTVSDTGTTVLGTPNATTQPLVPGAGGAPTKGSCTGIVSTAAPGVTATTPPAFQFSAAGKGPATASFIFVTEDGVLSAWAGGIDATQAFVMVDNSKTSSYKGLAIVGAPTPQLYAANFKTGTIDVFDANFKPVTLAAGAFTDPFIPAGFAPFNIWPLGGKLYVAYALQDANKQFDVAGPANGYVDTYDFTGKLIEHLIAGGPGFFNQGTALNSPWGLAIAPATFGKYANTLLVGNFGDGKINAFDPKLGSYIGTLTDSTGKPIVIPGLWSLLFGNGGSGGDKDTLYFTAGPGGQKHGILGSINANPNLSASTIANAGQSGATGVAPNTFMTIKGTDMAVTKRSWAKADFGTDGATLPTSLDGVSVTVNGQAAFVQSISPVQVTVLTPPDLATFGLVPLIVTDNGLTSNVNVQTVPVAPGFYLADAAGHISATHSSGSPITSSSPATAGEVIALYGTGFGSTNPAVVTGQVPSGVLPLATPPTVTIGGQSATVTFAGIVGSGLYQINVVVPSGLTAGDVPVVATVLGTNTPTGALITVK